MMPCVPLFHTNIVFSPPNAFLFVMGLPCVLNCCSDDKPEAEVSNDSQAVLEQTMGGDSATTKAAKKRAGKRRAQARSKKPMSYPVLTCILAWPADQTKL